MSYINVFFKNDEIYKKSKNSFYIRALFLENKVIVEIDDLSKDIWQLPLKDTKDFGNPKIKEYTYDEFNKHYYIPSKGKDFKLEYKNYEI